MCFFALSTSLFEKAESFHSAVCAKFQAMLTKCSNSGSNAVIVLFPVSLYCFIKVILENKNERRAGIGFRGVIRCSRIASTNCKKDRFLFFVFKNVMSESFIPSYADLFSVVRVCSRIGRYERIAS
jgi:hypothetical protein